MAKNCFSCKYVSYELYQKNTCKSVKAMKDLKITHEDYCNGGLSCEDVYTSQCLHDSGDCKYFKLGFWAKVANFRNMICRKIFEFKISRVK